MHKNLNIVFCVIAFHGPHTHTNTLAVIIPYWRHFGKWAKSGSGSMKPVLSKIKEYTTQTANEAQPKWPTNMNCAYSTLIHFAMAEEVVLVLCDAKIASGEMATDVSKSVKKTFFVCSRLYLCAGTLEPSKKTRYFFDVVILKM